MNSNELIQHLLAEPDTAYQLPETRDPAFFQDFLRYCLAEVVSNPAESRDCLEIAQSIAPTSCDLVQVLGLFAISHRAIGHPEDALAVIDEAWLHVENCDSCPPDLFRRRAFIKRDLKLFSEALADADSSIEIYRALAHPGHDLNSNGLASALLCRGQVYLEAGHTESAGAGKWAHLSSAVEDISSALAMTSPTLSPRLHRAATFNLAVALAATGKCSDLLLADQHLRDARRLFKGIRTLSQERARLDWLTAMVRYELGTMKLHRVREYLTRARETFLELGLVYESVAVSADLARILFPDRRRVWEVFNTHQIDTFADRLSPELRVALNHLETAMEARGWNAFETIKASIEGVRQACGPQMLACLVTWRR